MNFFKRIIAAALAVAVSSLMFTVAFADTLIDSDTVEGNKIITITNADGIRFQVDYQGTGNVKVSSNSSNYIIDASTSVKANVVSNGCWAEPTVGALHVGWQVVNYYTGNDYGPKYNRNAEDTYIVSGSSTVSHNAPLERFTVFGAHTAYKDGIEIIQKYTVTYSF